jgi:hypothetical protein
MSGAPVLTRPRAARLVAEYLVVAILLLVSGAVLSGSPPPVEAEGRVSGTGDTALYKAVVARVRGGEGYYDAVGAELRARNYPVRPVFNWRQPTYAWLLARLPSPLWGSAILIMLGAAVVWAARDWLRSFVPALVVVGLMTVTMAGAFVRDFVFLQEAWAGTLIALATCLFARDRWRGGVAASFAALAFRELALLPCGIGLVLALRRRRGAEVGAWVAGLVVYGALMAWHFSQVTRHYQPGDLERSWLAHGGAAFVLATCRWNPLLIALPAWAVAIVLPFAWLGLTAFREAETVRVHSIVIGYVLAFLIVGNPFNDYWGAIYAPLLTLGFMGAPATVQMVVRALRSPPEPAPPSPDR